MSELDKTIEDLEAEVAAELEEGMHDAPKKGAVAPEKGSKVDGDVEDLGAPVVKGDEKKAQMLLRKPRKILLFRLPLKVMKHPKNSKKQNTQTMRMRKKNRTKWHTVIRKTINLR